MQYILQYKIYFQTPIYTKIYQYIQIYLCIFNLIITASMLISPLITIKNGAINISCDCLKQAVRAFWSVDFLKIIENPTKNCGFCYFSGIFDF